MWTGSSAAVRSVTAAASASGSRLSVRGSMSANTGRAPSNSITLALATNENGEVTTSSPADTPTARSARCSPAVPLDTALACGAPTHWANSRSNSGTRGPSESWPERSTSITAASSSRPRRGLASGMVSVAVVMRRGSGAARRAGSPRLRSRHVGRRGPLAAAAARLLGVGERVDQRLPRRRDDVLVDADRAPDVLAVGGVDEHARRGAGAVVLVEDAHLVVDELDVLQVGVDLADRVAQRCVERVDRAVALGRADVALAFDPDLDRRLGLHLPVGALLDDHPPRLQAEQRLGVPGLAPQEQVERPVCGLELVPAVLEQLDAVDHPLGGRVVELQPRGDGALGNGVPARELGHEQLT